MLKVTNLRIAGLPSLGRSGTRKSRDLCWIAIWIAILLLDPSWRRPRAAGQVPICGGVATSRLVIHERWAFLGWPSGFL